MLPTIYLPGVPFRSLLQKGLETKDLLEWLRKFPTFRSVQKQRSTLGVMEVVHKLQTDFLENYLTN